MVSEQENLPTIILVYLPTMSSSVSDAFLLKRRQMSMVKMVDAELKMDVRELIRAASITASIIPFSPGGGASVQEKPNISYYPNGKLSRTSASR